MKKTVIFLAAMAAICSCSRVAITGNVDVAPEIFPDYKEVTIPENIAPLNFSYLGSEPAVLLAGGKQIKAKDGLFKFSPRLWKSITAEDSVSLTVAVKKDGGWVSCKPFSIFISRDRIEPWMAYRLIPPGYQGWKNMGIFQRNLESYRQKAIITNDLSGENCVNCHSFPDRDASRMVFHARASYGGTILANGGNIEKLNTKTDSTISALVYPYWHPSGKYIAFSTNITKQVFFNHDPNRIEVFDSDSDVLVYDVENHSVTASALTKSPGMFETFPTFSPDGKWLYFCSAKAVEHMPEDYDKVKYGLYRIAFDAGTKTFGDSLEVIYDAPADSMSVSFPRISPDGNLLAFTLHDYGNFSIWHKEADIKILDLRNGRQLETSVMNSSDVESYHSWSGNSRWIVFSSRRDDGLYTRPYFAHIDSDGRISKPFLLPQKNPVEYYENLMFSYNIPELISGKVRTSAHAIVDCMRSSDGTDIIYEP